MSQRSRPSQEKPTEKDEEALRPTADDKPSELPEKDDEKQQLRGNESSGEEQDEEEEEEEQVPEYASEEEAAAGRKEALTQYNAGQYNEALKIQCGLLQFYTSRFGELHTKCALPYLDYGITLLSIVQSRNSLDALIPDEDEEKDIELAFLNLDAARVCFEKIEKDHPDDPEIQLRLAEVHDALAQLHLEGDNEEEAIREFEFVLAIRRGQPSPNMRLVTGTLFSIASCLLRAGKYDDAIKSFEEALAAAQSLPETEIHLRDEITQFLAEAKELRKRGGVEDLREEIRACFPDESSQVPDPETAVEQTTTALVQPLPAELQQLAHAIPPQLCSGIPPREDGRSCSISFLPPQGNDHSRSGFPAPTDSNRMVTQVAVRKRPKPASCENSTSFQMQNQHSNPPQQNEAGEPPLKQQRTQ